MRKWTEQQWNAIRARRGTVLVSAAAGSGKTSVLVERVIQRLTDPESPTPADRLLIVTFTNAAAAEMRERVEAAVLERVRQEPENTALRRQHMLVPKMNISTVHSFCSKLVREFFYELDIAPDYKIVSDKLRDDLIEEALAEITDEAFGREEYTLADAFSSEREDKKLYTVVKDLYEFTSSHLFPELWLAEKAALYGQARMANETPWGAVLCRQLREALHFCRQLTTGSIAALKGYEALEVKFVPVLAEELSQIEQLLQYVAIGDWDSIRGALQSFSFGRLNTPRGYGDDPLKNRISGSRDMVKKYIEKARLQFIDDEETAVSEIRRTGVLVEQLISLTAQFKQRFSQKKREKKLADYGDLEHWAIQLLLTEKNGLVAPSMVAQELSSRFEEIMVDEYQDTNEVQDWIFRALSRDETNKFMVGDVKQCIYSFRQAMPDIFIRYKEQFSPYNPMDDAYPATIVLDRNYRSRNTVIDSVNEVFQSLMSREAGGVEYTADEALVQGAVYPAGAGYETRLDFLETEQGVPMEVSEARHIAGVIRTLLADGLLITEGGRQRPVTYRDFCILLRSANRFAYTYARILEEQQIPAWAQVAEGFFSAPEIAQILSFLQVVDNPNQDIPLLSVLMGPIYGFSPDDLAALRVTDRKCSLYAAVLQDGSKKYTDLLRDLERYRLMAAHLPSDQLIDYLYAETGYPDLVLAMEGGVGRLANLRQLRQYAGDFESTGYAGLSAFVRFVERLKKNKSDLEGASLVSENADVVRVMSIHKSKGLEFPVCILAGCGRKKRIDTSDVVLHSELGLGLKLKDEETGARYTNLIHDSILLQNNLDAMSEEMRVLYVAMTRAKEKLIAVTSYPSIDKRLTEIAGYLSGERISPYVVKSLAGMGDWLLLCALKHPMGRVLRDKIQIDDGAVDHRCKTAWDIRLAGGTVPEDTVHVPAEVPAEPDMTLVERLRERLAYVYPYADLNRIPVRVTASALSEEQGERKITLPRPGFLSSKGLTPAERGIALHSYMQFCTFAHAAKNPQAECDRLVRQGFITGAEGNVLQLDKVQAFFAGNLGQRMLASPQVLKEQRFTANIPASFADNSFPAGEEVMLQGAVDCAFYEEGRLYIVDFKTDRVENGLELVALYGLQLRLYAVALAQVKAVPIGGCYLYSLHLNQAVEVE